jgi:hypothetical protein
VLFEVGSLSDKDAEREALIAEITAHSRRLSDDNLKLLRRQIDAFEA